MTPKVFNGPLTFQKLAATTFGTMTVGRMTPCTKTLGRMALRRMAQSKMTLNKDPTVNYSIKNNTQ
jgi:hypothetical protein